MKTANAQIQVTTDTKSSVSLDKATLHGNELIQTPIGAIELVNNYFDSDASNRLFDEMDYQRAVQSYIWSTPLVSVTTWRNREAKAFGVTRANDFVVLESLREKRGIVTGNLTTPYILNFSSVKDGPLIVDYPGGKTAGGILDFWQRPLADTGLTGPDQGKGGATSLSAPKPIRRSIRTKMRSYSRVRPTTSAFSCASLIPTRPITRNLRPASKWAATAKHLKAVRS